MWTPYTEEWSVEPCAHRFTKDFYDGYVILPCFKVKICDNCGEVTMICGKILSTIFAVFFAPFWSGKIVLKKGEQTCSPKT